MVTRVRFIGRIWRVKFLEELMNIFSNLCEEVRINSFIINVPVTDFDLLADVDVEDLKSKVVEILRKHGYSEKRLLSIKRVESVEVIEVKHEKTLEDFME